VDSTFEDLSSSEDSEPNSPDDQDATVDSESDTTNQAWYLDVKTRATVQVTSIPDGISNLKVSPDGNRLAFTAGVKMQEEPSDIYPDLPKADARIIDGLMYRHWDKWSDYKFSHIFISAINQEGCCGETFDLMEGIKADCPVPPFGGSEQFAWSPDGTEIAFTLKNVDDWARSTNSDIYLVKAEANQSPINISESNLGYDLEPVYSPDGKSIVFRSMKRAGFESDRSRVMLYDRQSKQTRELSAGLDQSAHGLRWSSDGEKVLFSSEIQGTEQIYAIDVDASRKLPDNMSEMVPDQEGGVVKTLTQGRYNWSVKDVVSGDRFLLVSRMDMIRPKELFLLDTEDASVKPLTHLNDEVFEHLELPIVEERFVEATDGKKIHTWVIHPPGFRKVKLDSGFPIVGIFI